MGVVCAWCDAVVVMICFCRRALQRMMINRHLIVGGNGDLPEVVVGVAGGVVDTDVSDRDGAGAEEVEEGRRRRSQRKKWMSKSHQGLRDSRRLPMKRSPQERVRRPLGTVTNQQESHSRLSASTLHHMMCCLLL